MTDEPVVTLRDVYQQTEKLMGLMIGLQQRNIAADQLHADHEARIRQLMEFMISIQQNKISADQLHADHENRIRSLEHWRYALPASLAISLGSIGLGLLAIIGPHL